MCVLYIIYRQHTYLSAIQLCKPFNVVYRFVSCDPIVSFIFLRSKFSGGAGPFTLENHIHIKALKMQGSPNN